MSSLKILFGGLCGFYFEDYGEKKGRLHALLVDCDMAMNGRGMERHTPILIFNIEEVDLAATTAPYDVIPGGTEDSGRGVCRLSNSVLRLYSAGTEVTGDWHEWSVGEVFPTELFPLEKAHKGYGAIDESCLKANPKKAGKAVGARIELGGGKLSKEGDCVVDWIFKPVKGNEVAGDFARIVQFETETSRPVIRSTAFDHGNEWVLAFKKEASVEISNFPAVEEHHHFSAYYDLHPNPPKRKDRGFPVPRRSETFSGVTTGCIPNGFSG